MYENTYIHTYIDKHTDIYQLYYTKKVKWLKRYTIQNNSAFSVVYVFNKFNKQWKHIHTNVEHSHAIPKLHYVFAVCVALPHPRSWFVSLAQQTFFRFF